MLQCFVQILIIAHVVSGDRIITTLRYSSKYVKPVIVHGKPAKKGDVPYMVSIKERAHKIRPTEAFWRSHCGGAIIGPKLVLSAAHCFESQNYVVQFKKDYLRVVAGDLLTDDYHNTVADTTGLTQWRHIERIVTHEDYHFPMNDIALVFISQNWTFNNIVSAISYAKSNSDYINMCTASGYGDIMHGTPARTSARLLIAYLYTLPRIACTDIWQMNMDEYICTRSANNDVASGDSGGPLTCRGTSERDKEGPKGILVGLVCGKNFDKTTLFTRVSAHTHFIETGHQSNLNSNVLCIIIAIVCLLLLSLRNI